MALDGVDLRSGIVYLVDFNKGNRMECVHVEWTQNAISIPSAEVSS